MTTPSPHEMAFAAFFAALPDKDTPSPEAVATAFATHLAVIEPSKLPATSQPHWDRIVTRLLKSPAHMRPIPQRAIAAISSWPSARVSEFVEALQAINIELERAANDRLADETNARVARAYL